MNRIATEEMNPLKPRVLFVCLVSLLLSSTLYAQAPPAKAVISGTVARATTGDPVNRATLTLMRVNTPAGPLAPAAPNAGPRGGGPQGQPGQQPPQIQQPNPPATATTDAQGKFEFKDVEPGSYRLTAARNGFARQEYGQRSLNRPGTVLNIREGQTINDVAFKLTPAGTISGRVADTNGEPLPGVTVSVLRSTFDASGKRTMQPVGSSRTNDLGEYRLYWLNPGRYFVNANSARSAADIISSQASQAVGQAQSPREAQMVSQAASLFGPGANPNEVADTNFGLTYYPGTTDATRAVAIELQPGNEIRAIDFTLAKQQRVKVTGRVVEAETGRPPQVATVSVMPKDSSSASLLDSLIGSDPGGSRYNPATGEFTVQNVASGSYWLQVIAPSQRALQAQTPGAAPANPADALAMLSAINSARIPIEVGNVDLDNVTLTVSSGVSIAGRIRLEGAPAGVEAGQNPLERVGITLQSTSGGMNILSMLGGGAPARPAADGTFSIPRITAGDYRVAVNGLGTNLYIKDARLGQTDVLQSIAILPPVNGTLEITLGANPGQVMGSVTDATLKPVSGVQAVLIPDQLRNRQDLYKTATTDQDGRFTLRGITPGDYRLFAWEDIEPFSYYDAEVLRQYEQQGKLVRIREGSAEAAELKIIPAAR
jgi:protocatechuate 3,4-dioxygenase beta subunit